MAHPGLQTSHWLPLLSACQWLFASSTKLVTGVNHKAKQARTNQCTVIPPFLSFWGAHTRVVKLVLIELGKGKGYLLTWRSAVPSHHCYRIAHLTLPRAANSLNPLRSSRCWTWPWWLTTSRLTLSSVLYAECLDTPTADIKLQPTLAGGWLYLTWHIWSETSLGSWLHGSSLDGVMRLWRFNSPRFVNVIMLQILIHFRSGALRCADDICLFVTGASLSHLVSPGVGKPLTDTLSWTYPEAEHTFLLPIPLSCSWINLQCLSLNCRRQRLLGIPQISPSLLPILNFNRLLIYLSVMLAVILDGLSWSPPAGKRLLPMDLPSKQASAHFPSTISSEPGWSGPTTSFCTSPGVRIVLQKHYLNR